MNARGRSNPAPHSFGRTTLQARHHLPDKQSMGILASKSDEQMERVVLKTSVAASVVAMGLDLVINQASVASWIRSLIYLSVATFALQQLRQKSRVQLLQIYLAIAFGGVSLVDSAFGTDISLIDPGVTLTLLVLLSVTYLGLRDNQSERPIIGFNISISMYSIATVLLVDYTLTHTLGFLLVGVLGQTLVLWVVYQLIVSLGEASTTESKHARISEALAHCSQALLNRGTQEPLNTALRALLDATDADYAYIDVTRIDAGGLFTWEIVAEAVGGDYPGTESTFVSGDYAQQEDILERLKGGRPARVVTSELPMPLRDRYEREGIKAELIAPIMIGDRWTGTIGYTDHIREDSWTDIEVKALMRAAEMVGAYWEREAAREGLMELAQAKDRFIAAVSHELRTPLAAVVGFAGALAQGMEEYTSEELAEMSSMIYSQSLELTHLVDDLLTSERAASGNLTVTPGKIFLLQECRDIVESTISHVQTSVIGDEVIALADALRTRQIIRNLLTNAIRYGGSSIVIAVAAEETSAKVTVKDDGKGVSNLDADRIFDPYYRSQHGRSTPDSVGLGLAVARQLARLMGGDVVYRRTAGWTEFEFTLPLPAGDLTSEGPITAIESSSPLEPDSETVTGDPRSHPRGVTRETVTVTRSPSPRSIDQ